MTSLPTERALERAERHCSTRGTRLTEKRRVVLTGLLESGRALSAYELIDFCRDQQGVELLPMTVYRILDFLEGEHLVHRLNLFNKYVACSDNTCDREHQFPQFLICKTCQKVEEIVLPRQLFAPIAETIAAAGYQLASHQLELDCVCGACAEQPPGQPPALS